MKWALMLSLFMTNGWGGKGWTPPVVVGEFPSLESCKTAADSAVYKSLRDGAWKELDEARICISKGDAK